MNAQRTFPNPFKAVNKILKMITGSEIVPPVLDWYI